MRKLREDEEETKGNEEEEEEKKEVTEVSGWRGGFETESRKLKHPQSTSVFALTQVLRFLCLIPLRT